jgi:PadR family transcriptional regulator AphA
VSIKYAILGLLSSKPSTGYEMKKVFEESSAMYWSGNNNQIYKSLIELLNDGLVTSEIQHQETSPSKKIYTITGDGLAELKKWVLSPPEAPEFKKTFLVQLAWADQLSNEELNELMLKYENEIKIQLLLHQEKNRRGLYSPDRNPREALLWNSISDNLTASLKGELEWIQGIRKELFEKEFAVQRDRLQYVIIEKEGKRYIELLSAPAPLGTEQDALDLIALCGEKDTNLLMLHYRVLEEGFFRHKTGMAGKMLQKFSNYFIKAAVVKSSGTADQDGNKGLTIEIGKSNTFKVFETKENAEAWLLS